MESSASKIKAITFKGLKKKSYYNLFFEFQTSFQNANIQWKSFFYCRHSILLEKILFIMWDLHCINGYLVYKSGTSYFLKVRLKKDLNGHSAVNQIICYPSLTFLSWINLKKILNKECSIIYIVTTTAGIFDGYSAVKKGLGGCLLYKILL